MATFKSKPNRNYDDIKEYMRRNPERFLATLTKAKYKTHVCPICGSGSGPSKTGMSHEIKNGVYRFKCFANGCFEYDDVLEVIQKTYGLSDFHEAMKLAAEIYGIDLETFTPPKESIKPIQTEKKASQPEKRDHSPEVKEYLKSCQKHLSETDYFESRGISKETAERFGCGYDPNYEGGPHVILPTDQGGYSMRATDPKATIKHRNPEGLSVGMFNTRALDGPATVIFVTEAPFDAMSIYEAGGEAIALSSTSQARRFIETAAPYKNKRFILALDDDEAGKNAAAQIQEALPNTYPFFLQGFNDPNDFLKTDREGLSQAVGKAIQEAKLMIETSDYFVPSAADLLEDFDAYVQENRNKLKLSTGFGILDDYLDGGLRSGLYVLGALSSLGKTTLALQIADNLAKQGHDTLIFSLEMSRNELIAKSISRETFLAADKRDTKGIKKVLEVLEGFEKYDEGTAANNTEKEIMKKARAAFREFGKNLYIVDGSDNPKGTLEPADMRKYIEHHIAETGKAPFVIVDYLQIMPDVSQSADRRALIDATVTQSKIISADFDIPVMLISSLNRDSYNTAISMTSFKESGGIEYSADVVLGLQVAGVQHSGEGKNSKSADNVKAITDERGKDTRRMELKILKNRHGKTPSMGIIYHFNAPYNHFEEIGEIKPSN